MSNTYHMYISACYVICSNQFDLSLYTFLCSRPHLGNKVLTCNNSAPLVLGGNTPGASRGAARGPAARWARRWGRSVAQPKSAWLGNRTQLDVAGKWLDVNLKPSGDISEYLVSLGGLGVS